MIKWTERMDFFFDDEPVNIFTKSIRQTKAPRFSVKVEPKPKIVHKKKKSKEDSYMKWCSLSNIHMYPNDNQLDNEQLPDMNQSQRLMSTEKKKKLPRPRLKMLDPIRNGPSNSKPPLPKFSLPPLRGSPKTRLPPQYKGNRKIQSYDGNQSTYSTTSSCQTTGMSGLEPMNYSYDDVEDFGRTTSYRLETVARGARRKHFMNASVNLEQHKARINQTSWVTHRSQLAHIKLAPNKSSNKGFDQTAQEMQIQS